MKQFPEFDYIGIDLGGYRFNRKYPPNSLQRNTDFMGYTSWNREALFYQFAVQGYDVSFDYNGKTYYIMYQVDGAARCRVPFNDIIEQFSSPVSLIENMDVESHKLIDVIDELTNVEVH